ncbi:T1SS-143 repeat domain-containing protein [Vibrio ouci]|uniref:Type I secretion C-terminal target domain-containing protein n=1 Tax=Vibrio ouci TaxID=2499078 RepID=A0A4Y8WHY0_9VIBR|nr:type I secretion C-terminal target domain-containing protein [Vibrio ouci]TFH92424.1 type I secretion C-terminal target domain-containing protein [Vibrio ouci]
MNPILYIEVGGVLWQVLPDGTWQRIPSDSVKEEGVIVVTQSSEADNAELTQEEVETIEEQLEQVVEQLSQFVSRPQGNSSSDNVDSQGASFVEYVQATLDETIAQAGFDTRPDSPFENDDNIDTPEVLDILSQNAELTVDILDGGDGYENRFEVPGVTIQGTALDVRDGRIVNLTITDVNGNSVSVTAITQDEAYQIDGVNLSSLAEGPLTVTAVIADNFGNSILAQDTTIKDTLAEIEVNFDGFGDEYYNQFEVSAGRIEGTVSFVQDGQPITIKITDKNGQVLTFSAVVEGSSWSIENIDFSAFADGILTVEASTIDIAGNPATYSDTIVKDVVASITAQVEDGGDNVLNSTEKQSATFRGVVTDVEDGQSVTVVITDSSGATLQFETVVVSGVWVVENVDISAFADGVVTVEASTVDIAGNPATTTDTSTSIDTTVPTIDIDTLTGFSILDFRTGNLTTMQGTTTGVDEGLPIYIHVSDGAKTLVFEGVVDASGNWTITDIDISSLDLSNAWTIEAQVFNAIGNEAIDDMPTIVLPESLSFAEAVVGIFGSESKDSDINVEFADFQFYSDQSLIEGLTSKGLAITVTVAVDSQSLEGRDSDGNLVFSAAIIGDQVRVSFFQAIDQVDGLDSIQTAILVEGTQTDADGTTETVIAHLPITIKDSEPLVFGETYQMVEGTTASGNLLNNDIDLDGDLFVRQVEVDGTTKAVTESQPATFTLAEGTLTVFANGHWTFVANRNLDHNSLQNVTINYIAGDASNDFGDATAVINIIDGEQGAINGGSTVSTENSLADRDQTLDATFTVTAGSDNPDPASLQFDESTLALLNSLGLESTLTLNSIDFALSAGNTVITATSNGNVIFTLTLSGVASGDDVTATIQLVQSEPISHLLSSDNVTLPLVITGNDLDGTELDSGRFEWTISDGDDPLLSNGTSVAIDETELAAGSVSKIGQFSLEIGSDYLDSVYFDIADQPSFTSGGIDIIYVVNGDGSLSAYTQDPNDATQPDILVFTVSFSQPANDQDATVDYTFTLERAFDQINGTDPLPIVVSAKDADGDVTKLELDISITDGGDSSIGTGTVELSEVPIVDGVAAGPTAEVSFDVSSAFDPIVFLGLNVATGDAVLDSNGNPLTQNGVAITWRDNGDGTYDAVLSSGEAVFNISLPADFLLDPDSTATITVSLELYQSIDHIGAGNDTELTIPVPVYTVDSDGSENEVTSNIKIYDGVGPEINIVGSISVDEDGLYKDNEDVGVETTAPSIEFIEGSDDIVSIDVDLTAFNAKGYTSGGSAITLSDADVDGWYFGVDASSNPVFQIRLGLDGSVEFILLAPLDHPTGLGENNLPLEFPISVTDADGDASPSVDYIVNVTDDVPTTVDSDVALVEGESLSGNLITAGNRVGADGGKLVSLGYDSDGDGNPETFTFIDDATPVVINLYNPNDTSNSYGTLTVYQDGTYTLTTNASVMADPQINDLLNMTIEDFDGDIASSEVTFVLGDNNGVIRVEDVEIREDNLATLSITVSTGDIDQNEQVSQITISESSLQGGQLFLNGVLLVAVNGQIVLSGSQLNASNPTSIVPNGDLTYLPPTHQSNTTIDITLDVGATITSDTGDRDLTETIEVSVLPVADTPEWGDSVFTYETIEDADSSLTLDIAANLVDVDSSETLKYIINNIPDGITILLDGVPITEGKQYSQGKLNQMEIVADANVAGQFTFDVTAVAIEDGNNFASNDDKKADTTEQITVNVRPDADAPTLSVKDIKGLEDEVINLQDYIFAHLTDTDGSESLSLIIEVQDGWEIVGGSLTGTNTYVVSAQDIADGNVTLIPKEDISSFTEDLEIYVTAISTESTQDGLHPSNPQASSPKETITVYLKGIVDEPTVVDGGQGRWQYDDATKVISNLADLFEDELIALDFLVQTTDDDVSEEINILITNIPAGTVLVDAAGNPVVLTIASINDVTGPVYQVSNEELANLYLKPVGDFSGELSFDVIVVSTEPDGDSGEFPLTVEMEVLPKVDQEDGQVIATSGAEDRSIGLNLTPSINQDVDGSESLTGYTIVSLDPDLTLYFDGSPITIDASGLDLATLLDATSPTLADLLNSGRLSVVATEDLSGVFNIGIRYEVTDTSPTGATDVKQIDGSLSVTVNPKVELDTRLEGSGAIYSSDDGSAVDISDAVTFVDADLDGSEFLDYIIIVVPDGYNLIVHHPNGASQDADGNWIIPADGLTSDSIKESFALILNGATISSPQDTPLLDIVVKARVLDGDDARFIDATFQLEITGHGGGGGTCYPVEAPGDIQSGDIKQPEGDEIDLSGLLDSNVASDPGNELSFYIPADSLPEGVEIEGDGVTAEYDRLGNVIGYSITGAALENLKLTGVDEDFAGCLTFTVQVIETSPCNGSTLTTDQTITIQVTPVVDDITVSTDSNTIKEDTATDLNLELILGDSIEDGQTITGEGNSATGKETLNSLTVSLTAGATLAGPADVLQNNNDGTWTILDPTRLNEIQLVPPEHYSGDISMTFTANITDAADCVSETDTQDKSTTVVINVEPVADMADLVTSDVLGNEDEYIYLGSMTASLVDQDGSESMSLSLKGVPEGAVVVYKVGDSYVLAPNNGADGGSFNGKSTYEWQLDSSRLGDVYILPPRDFSGDIPLSLEAITQELENGDFNFTQSDFIVGVLPVGDRVELVDLPETMSGEENDGLQITLDASSFETFSDEYLIISLTINNTSDPSALTGLDQIRIGLQSGLFIMNIDGSATATVLVKVSEVDKITFFPGDAFGDMDVTITAATYDENTVLGNLESDIGDPVSEDLVITITPEPDEPILTTEYESIIAEADGDIPLGLSMSLINPADNESGFVTISGLPSGLVLSAGTLSDGKYTVSIDELESLSIVDGYNGAVDFQLTIEPTATIGSAEAAGIAQVIDVSLLDVTDNTYQGSNGVNDLFVISNSSGSDTITSFDYSPNSDAIDISAIVDTVTDGELTDVQLDALIDMNDDSGSVTIQLKPDGATTQQEIVLDGVTLDDLYGADSSAATEADILQKMIDDQNLILQ